MSFTSILTKSVASIVKSSTKAVTNVVDLVAGTTDIALDLQAVGKNASATFRKEDEIFNEMKLKALEEFQSGNLDAAGYAAKVKEIMEAQQLIAKAKAEIEEEIEF